MADPAVPNLYQVLMIDRSADLDILSTVHRQLARRYHPDLHPSPAAYARMLEVNRAYDVLRDPVRRAQYDRQLDPVTQDWDTIR